MAFNPNKLVSMNYNLYLPLLVSFYMAFNPNKLVVIELETEFPFVLAFFTKQTLINELER